MPIKYSRLIKVNQRYTGRLCVADMYNHIINQDLIYCSNGRLYFYHPVEGWYVPIEVQEEWHVLSIFFSTSLCNAISSNQVSEIIKRVKNTSFIQISADSFNSDPDLINIKNGVLNYRTRELLPKASDYRFTYQLNVSYKQELAKCDISNFLKFCETSLDNDQAKIDLLLQIIGYLCSPLLNAKKCFVLLGAPNSGKSLILHLIEYIIGKSFISNIPLENLGHRFSTAVLSTKILNVCAELSAQPLKNIEAFKLIVGGDTLSGEYKNKDIFQFNNRCKLLFAGNMLPPIKNEDISSAFIDRLTILRFTHSIPQEERQFDLLDKLKDEADAIFTFSLKALDSLIKNNFEFIMPDDSSAILDDYAFQTTNIDFFISEWCELNDGLKIHSAVLYDSYKKFCSENAISPISQNLFSQKIGSVSNVTAGRFRIDGSNPIRGFYGISLKKDHLQDSRS